MANKTIINSAPPKPSKRVIGGSNQRSKARLNLQGSHGWALNHAPIDSDESKNAIWWKENAERYDAPLSSSGDVLYTRQSAQREVQRESDKRRIYNLDAEINKSIKGGSNQPFNKKNRLTNIAFGDFEQEINITDELYPNLKKRLSVKATIDGQTYVGEQVLPFSAFSSSVNTGYQSFLSSSGYTDVDFANLHNDKIQPYNGEVPLQGPFTERYVGGIQARHNAPLRTSERKEQFSISLDGGFAIASITIDIGGGFDIANYDGKEVTLDLDGVSFITSFDIGVNIDESTESVSGIADALNVSDVATALKNSLNAAITAQGLRIFVEPYSSGAVIFVSSRIPGPSVNGIEFAGSLISSIYGSTAAFAGGKAPSATIDAISGANPRGQYLRGQAAKAPVNIRNIKTLFTSDSVRVVGNYVRNYEVVQGANRAATNMDLAYNTDNYSYQTPSAFVTTPDRRTLGLTGSADFPAPRQITSRKINETIIVNRFSAPGDKVDSKQQFRDVASDQFSSNNALPFRNLPVRNPYIKQLATHTDFGGFEPGSTTVASVHKTQRNQTQRVEASGSTFVTGTVYDAYFVTRPVPAGDSTQWFFALSGSDTNTYSNYVLSGSKYPEDITLSRTNITADAPSLFDPGTGGFTWTDGNTYYIWSDNPYNAPWSQIATQYKNAARYLRKNNLYELLPEEVVSKDAINNLDSTQSRTSTDQAGNTITNYYSQAFIEPPITSRYKPLVHQIETFIGSPSETTDNKITLNLEYSYGNSLMGFANRELNRQLAGDLKFAHNKIKRPYEALREQLNSDSSRTLNGVNMIKMFAYNETIFPREINTYLSGSRARLAFANSYWKNDADIETVTTFYSNFDVLFYSPTIEARDNRQVPRLTAPFTTSQGYVIQRSEQLPYNPSNPSTPQGTGPGTASIWPMDSYLWSDLSDTYAGSAFNTGTYSASVILADQSTTACGELMMTHYGTVIDYTTDSNPLYVTSSRSYYLTADTVSSQYVYNIAFATGTLSTLTTSVEPRIPGGPFSRPAWTAASERRFVDGENKGDLATQVYPFYNSYDQWVAELRLKGKAHTIIPEYRVSEHVSEFKTNRTLFTAISSSLEITGANTNNFDGTNTDFYTRYSTTDNMEFLSDFMTYDKGDVNFIFNDYPRHFEINSDAIMKLLPYDGFYPMNRTLEISTLFSQSYSAAAQFTGSEAGAHSQWRTLLRPYFAPGIMYNSIKSGVAVDYPIRRVTRNEGQYVEQNTVVYDPIYPGYKIGYPLFGSLYGALTGAADVSGTIPGGQRRNREDFDWTDPDVNALFWADRLPFESILAPEDYLTADLGTTTGSLATVMSDINTFLHLDVTASFTEGQIDSNNLYKKAVSNFLANVPQFFLKTKENKFGSPGKLTKFVSQFGSPSKGSQEVTAAARTVTIDPKKAYMMEIGLMKTDQFNMYSNPAAFGPATNTSYIYQPWEIAEASGSWVPSGSAWPKHRGEFAPFTPPYYYGPSLARITFMPLGDKEEYTLEEILNNDRGEVFVDFLNESGSYYDATSGSYVDAYGNTITTNTTPAYKWNRAWLNRMDIDASINIDNEFPTSAGSSYKSVDPNKWTIMPKWESPILDFPSITRTPAVPAVPVAYATASATMAAGLVADYDTLDLVIETSTVTVTFTFDAASVGPSRTSATDYKVGYSGSSGNPEVAQALSASVALALSNAEIDVTPFVSDSLSSIVVLTDNVGGTGINGKALTGDTVTLGYITQSPFAGGADATPGVPASTTVDYNFSSSVNPSEFTSSAQGMWHQYGSTPDEGEGVYMYIKDIPTDEDEEYDLIASLVYSGAMVGTVGSYDYVRKVPKYVIDSNRTVTSLADLCGFDPDEIIRKGFDPKKAKRLGELAEDNENSISEAVVALPFYLDENGEPKLITLQASPTELGPKIKEFRKNFTKYSLPPVLAQKLLGLVPKGYPTVADTINPFGGDEYDEILSGEDIKQIPVVYLMEHTAQLTKQDLADIWQGIMPDLARRMNFSFSAIDHYMPGDNVEDTPTQFPEVLKEQINLGAVRDGNPRYDLLDIAEKACKQGFFPEIKWLVFKVKEKGYSTYAEMIIEEVDGPNALGYDNAKEFMTLQGLPEDQVDRILGDRDEFAKNAYISKHSLDSPTYNWPYDYCSLIESVKINSKVGFRPDLEKEYEETEAKLTQQTIDEKAGNK